MAIIPVYQKVRLGVAASVAYASAKGDTSWHFPESLNDKHVLSVNNNDTPTVE
jgi:hypothetical protein